MLRLYGIQKPIHGLLVDISVSGCRFRSLTLLERGQRISFAWKRAGHPTLELRGKIISRRKQASLEYGVEFEPLLPRETDTLHRELMELQRRAAAARDETEGESTRDAVSKTQRRHTFRTVVTVNLTYKIEDRPGSHPGIATDLSAGGLRLTGDEALLPDEVVTLTFTLPSAVLGNIPEHVDVIDVSPFGPRILKKPHPQRPFEEITVRAKVAARFPDSRGRVVVGVQFIHLDAFDHEQIARYIHAAQLYKLRLSS